MNRTDDKLKFVKVNQTSIQIYQTARGEYQFRYYLGGKSQRVTRSNWEKIKAKAMEIATSIENGWAKTGIMTTAEVWFGLVSASVLGEGQYNLIMAKEKRLHEV